MNREEFEREHPGVFLTVRGTGITTKQMKKAPKDAVYVWCNEVLHYPKALAKKHGREDLEIVSPEWIDGYRWMGKKISAIVIDHACELTGRQLATLYNYLLPRVQMWKKADELKEAVNSVLKDIS